MSGAIHHIELWTSNLTVSEPEFHWLLTSLGWAATPVEGWDAGRVWTAPSGEYLVLEQSRALRGEHDRMRAGLNHLALCVRDRQLLDRLRNEASAQGWRELFAERYPHAGGEQHVALYLENSEGFEVELVVA